MPLTAPTPPYGEVLVFYDVYGVRCVNRFFYDGIIGLVGSGDADNWNNAWGVACLTPFRNLLSTECTIQFVITRLRTTTQLWQGVGHDGLAGERPGPALPPQNTCNITWDIDNTGGGSRIVRGRTFLSVGVEDDLENGLWKSDLTDDVKTFADALLVPAAVGENTLTPIIWRPRYLAKSAIIGRAVSPEAKMLRHRRLP